MHHFPLPPAWFPLASLAITLPATASVVDVTPTSGLLDITQVVYQRNGSTITQNTEATGVTDTSDDEIVVRSVRITDGTPVDLTFFNTTGAKVVNVNPELGSTAGVGVFNNGVMTTSASGLDDYASAFAGTSLDTDLNNYTYHDYLSPGPTTTGTPDLDLLFWHALNPGEDYFLVAERWGNAQFSITALDENGNPYQDANVLMIGGNGGSFGVGYEVYDWTTGYAAETYVSEQAQALSLFSVDLFFDGTIEPPSPVYGLRIDNDGEADPKIVGISGNTFSDNPENPLVVPEPSSFWLAGLAASLLAGRRRRNA
ncbi:MAG: PEP-CTERM sorting domain-containing protein [Verrucomicrobiales bacterium]|nr:PEP-CTERM sorting domain-containing protein [Verrucomicrobiota bacterium JB025]